jgi:hypothetical protein
VEAGQILGYTNGLDHLHFGIHPGYELAENPWRGYTHNESETYGWVDPVQFLLNNSAQALDITPPTIATLSQSPSVDVGEGQLVKVSANITDAGTGVKNATLIYSNDNGTSWKTPLPMVHNSTTGLYESTILGHISGTWVKYEITAYDNAGNLMTENNAGQYYSYTVIPEFPATYVILLFILATTLAVTTYRKSKRAF